MKFIVILLLGYFVFCGKEEIFKERKRIDDLDYKNKYKKYMILY